MGSKGLGGHAGGMRGSGGGGEGAGGLDPIGKSRYMGRFRSPSAPDEISWFRAWGGGGNLFTGMH